MNSTYNAYVTKFLQNSELQIKKESLLNLDSVPKWYLWDSLLLSVVCAFVHTSIFFIIMVYCCLWADDNMGFGGGDQSLSLAITTYFFTVGHSHFTKNKVSSSLYQFHCETNCFCMVGTFEYVPNVTIIIFEQIKF